MSDSLVSCLTATYGRYSVLRDAITCFIEQDYEKKELIILNNHPIPIHCNLPQVTVHNTPGYPTLGHCRNRLLELANGEFVRTWDDDDLYLPWAISQGVEMILDEADIWQPNRSWSWHKDKDRCILQGNVYEASWTTRTGAARKVGYKLGGGNEHAPLKKLKRVRTEMGPEKSSYVYTWGTGLCHISGTLGHKNGIEWRTQRWMKKNNDHGNEKLIELTDLTPYWERIKKARKEHVD